MDSPPPETLEQLRAENQRLRAQLTALTAAADSRLAIPGCPAPDPPLWFDAVSDAIIVTDAGWHIQHWNQAAAQIYGWPPEMVCGRLIAEITPVVRYPDGESADSVGRALSTNGVWRGEVVQQTCDGREVVIDASVRAFADDQRRIAGYITINRDITERTCAEAVVRANEQRLVLALDAAQLIAWEWDAATDRLAYYAHASRSFGIPQGELASTLDELTSKIYPADLPRFLQAMQAGLRSHEPVQIQVRVVTPAGRLYWIEIHGLTQHDAAGRPVRVVGVTRDINAERQMQADAQVAHQAAAAALARLDAIVASTPTGIAYLDRALRYQLVNPALAALNGRAPAEHLGRTVAEVIPNVGRQMEPLMREVLTTGVAARDLELHGLPHPLDEIARDMLISLFPVPGPAGEVAGVGVALTDLTQRRRAEEALRASEERFSLLAEHAHDVIFRYGMVPALRLEYFNPAIERMTGYPLDAFYHDPDLSRRLVHPDDQAIFTHRPSDFVARPQPLILRWVHQDGSHRWAELYSWLVPDAAGRPVAIEGIARDISARKQAEAALQAHAEALSRANAELTRALRLKDEFLAMMSHELRTPLTVILGVCEAMEIELYGPIAASQRQALATVMQSGRQLLAILSGILDLAHIEAGQTTLDPQPMNLDTLALSAIELVQAAAQQKAIDLQHRVAPGVARLSADQRRLTQILVNLLDNAIKFTPEGGAVGLEVMANAAQEQIQFVIWDTGIGIAAAEHDRLFQPFTQVDGRLSRRYGGVGLGLSLVRRLVELHDGSICLESAPGQGSRFTVSLPWAEREHVAAGCGAPAAQPPQPWARPPRVVLADDHEPTLTFYQEMLIRQGAQVTVARTGDEALAQVRAQRPDVAILDIQMPGIDGLEAIRRIRSDPGLAGVPVIALTALTMPGDRERCLAAGASTYLAKPVGLRALAAAITAVLPPASANAWES